MIYLPSVAYLSVFILEVNYIKKSFYFLIFFLFSFASTYPPSAQTYIGMTALSFKQSGIS